MTTSCTDETTGLILAEEPYLHLVARRLTRCASDADDLVQETLLRAFDARDRFRPGSSARAWTCTILRRLHIGQVLRARRRRVRTDTDSGGALETTVARTPARHFGPPADAIEFSDGLEDAVKRAFDGIPDVYRETFWLAVVRELPYGEIAQRLGVPVGTVMSRVHRTRERLRRALGPRCRRRRTSARAVVGFPPMAEARAGDYRLS